MESKRIIIIVAIMAMIMMMATSSAAFAIDGDSVDLVSDGRLQTGLDIKNGCPRKAMIMKGGAFKEEGRRCPRIYMECKRDADCLADCVCLQHGICG